MIVLAEALADDALLLRFGEHIDAALNQRVMRLASRLKAQPPPWLRDVVPAYASLAVFFDPLAFNSPAFDSRAFDSRTAAGDAHAQVEAALRALLRDDVTATQATTSRIVEIPVCYGGDHGADLASSAAELGLSADELVRRHAAADYQVAMIGFAPGFPYLIGLDPDLALPRLATPRTSVPPGSVAIGGAQTGIYPRAGAGGWRLLGRTPLPLFDAARPTPALLAPGDRVRFVPVDAARFEALRDG